MFTLSYLQLVQVEAFEITPLVISLLGYGSIVQSAMDDVLAQLSILKIDK